MSNIDELGKILLKISRKTIEDSFTGTLHFDKSTLLWLYPVLTTTQATFITLNINNRLRGCIGSLVAHRSMLDDIIANSYAAAFKDPRFNPLSKAEASIATIEISLLTSPKQVEFENLDHLKTLIVPERDGIILQVQKQRATYLPHVWKDMPDFKTFFDSLWKKAGIKGEPFSQKAQIFSYEVKRISEL